MELLRHLSMGAQMKAMVCEMCGGNDVMKVDGAYVCQYCGTKYDIEEARKLIVTVSGPVTVDGVATTDNLMDRAQEFFDKGDNVKALEYVNRVLDIDSRNQRARDMQRAIEGGVNRAAPPGLQSTERWLRNVPISEAKYRAIVAELQHGNRVYAINRVMEATGWSFKESQEYVEYVLAPSLGLAEQNRGPSMSVGTVYSGNSGKSRTAALLLCLFFGYIGVHCFYTGKIGKGILYFFTWGLFGIGWLWDMIQIIRGKSTDKNGLLITSW